MSKKILNNNKIISYLKYALTGFVVNIPIIGYMMFALLLAVRNTVPEMLNIMKIIAIVMAYFSAFINGLFFHKFFKREFNFEKQEKKKVYILYFILSIAIYSLLVALLYRFI